MGLNEIALYGGGGLAVLLTLIQIAPIKISPWTAIARALGRAINAEVMHDLDEIKKQQAKTQKKLEQHVQTDDERNADLHRLRILQFNNELLREIQHTREDFIEVLAEIDFYESYCKNHPDYQNNRCVHAIANISRVYDERLQKRDFL